MHILIIILRTAEGCATNALDKKKLLMIIRGFRPTSDIIDFTSVERCNQYYISRESHFKWRILSLEKIHCTKRNLKFLSIAVYCNKSMSDKELQIKKKFKPVLATKYWALLCCKLCKVNSTTVEQHQKKGNKVFTYCKNPELKAINRCRSKVKPQKNLTVTLVLMLAVQQKIVILCKGKSNFQFSFFIYSITWTAVIDK